MNFLRSHWYDAGAALAVIIGIALFVVHPQGLSRILWTSFVSLLLHQFEEYRFPGTFPGMMNKVMFASDAPDRYPLNSLTALIVNLGVGWVVYLLAAIFGPTLVWLAIAAILVSVGNLFAHTFLFNIRGRTIYNVGMVTSIVLFLPISGFFFYWITTHGVASPLDWAIGAVCGVALNFLGIVKMIDLLKDRNTRYVFPPRNVLAESH